MNRIGEYSWWPNAWIDDRSHSISSNDIRENAVLKNVRRKGDELTLIVDHRGTTCTAKIGAQLSDDFLILLRHVLLQHWGQPISAVENFEIKFAV
jgi:hypothetical protein